jgi:hypothetical protein
MNMNYEINTIQDAETFTQNSGVYDWSWGGKASAEGFVEWVYRNCSEIDSEDYDSELEKYLVSCGENPAQYLS